MYTTSEQSLIGDDPELRRLLKAAKVVAATDVNVLLLGESGTGKEILARSLHRWSPRATGQFVSVHCAGLDEAPDLPALCERGRGHGTLFLDEVSELTPKAQAGLLRCLETLELDRELRNLCERLVILLPGVDITPSNLPAEIRGAEAPSGDGLGFRLPAGGVDLEQLEIEAIRQALTMAAGNKSRAARLLGLTRDTLLYRMRKHLIQA
jgi:DNA-binding NtrC family response regulator